MVWILTKNLAKSRVNEKLAIPSVVSKKKEEGGGSRFVLFNFTFNCRTCVPVLWRKIFSWANGPGN